MSDTNGDRKVTDNASADPAHWSDAKKAAFIDEAILSINTGFGDRSNFFNSLLSKRRKIDEECDYPPPGAESIDLFKELYDRDPIAARVVQCLPYESWQITPFVYETEGGARETKFEQDWDAIGRDLNAAGSVSWNAQEQGSIIWDYFRRLDVLSGIGHFGVLLLGIDDGRNLQDPAEGAVTIVKNADGSERLRVGSITTNSGVPCPDGWMTAEDEQALERLKTTPGVRKIWTHNDDQGKPQYREIPIPVLTANEAAIVDQWKYERGLAQELTRNVQQPTANKVIDHIEEVTGTDRQYSEFGSLGMGMAAPLSADLSGTEKQYFGVQFGPSEAPSDTPSSKKHKLLFLRPFDESLVQIVRYEWNIRNPRFGQPVMYRVTLNDPREQHSGVGLPLATVFVHWSRVIHVPCDDQGSSEIFGPPRMRCVLNRLLDIRKLFASSAEGYWQSCFTALSIETHPQLGGDVKINVERQRDMMLEFRNRLRRDIMLQGQSAKTLAPTVVDPTPFITGQIEALCIKLAIPKRVFMGSERGELASAQDDSKFNDVLRARQAFRLTPRIIVPFIDRCILLGILTPPDEEDGYTVDWPDLESLSDKDKAGIALQVTQAIAAYVAGNCQAIIDVKSYMVKVLEWTEEEADEYIDEAAKKMEEDLKAKSDLADQHGFEVSPPPGLEKPAPPPPPMPPPDAVKLKPGEKLVHPPPPPNKPAPGDIGASPQPPKPKP